jgi:hypothetical protein
MLIDNDENQSEVDIEESKAQANSQNTIPDKYRDKSLDDIIKMHQEAEKLIGKQAQEVGEVRKLADELIKNNLVNGKQQTIEVEPEVDFFEDPKRAMQRTVDNHPDVLAGRNAAIEFKKMQIQNQLNQDHPDYKQVVNDAEFIDWVKSSNVRIGLYTKANADFDYDSANELISTFKQLRGVKMRQTEQDGESTRKQNLNSAMVDSGGTGESSRKVYRRADLIRLKMNDPARYEALSDEIMAAYAENRVK